MNAGDGRPPQDIVDAGAGVSRVLSVAKNVLFRNRWTKGLTGLWVLGLLAAFVLPAPVSITDDMTARFTQKSLAAAKEFDRPVDTALSELYFAEDAYKASRGWFPFFASAQRKAQTAALKRAFDARKRAAAAIQAEQQLALREANKELGLFTSYGISTAKDEFWRSFESAKVIGRRHTFIDGISAILFQRDREVMDIVVKLAFYLIINMGVAMFFMFWLFVGKLPHIIWSFGASWVESVSFFLLAFIAAASVMLSFLGLLTGATGGAVYGLARMADRRAAARLTRSADGRRQLRWQGAGGAPAQEGAAGYGLGTRLPTPGAGHARFRMRQASQDD